MQVSPALDVREMIAAQKAARMRLRRPSNAVIDLGIDLKRHRVMPVKPSVRVVSFPPIPLAQPVPEPATPKRIRDRKKHDAVTGPRPLNEICEILLDYMYPELQRRQVAPSVNQPMARIIKTVAEYYGISLMEIRNERRTRAVVWPRQVAAYLGKELTTLSLPKIGQMLGGKDHTTILHAVRKVTALRVASPSVDETIETIMERIVRA